MATQLEDPAGRLAAVLRAARAHTPETQAIDGWSKTLGVSQGDAKDLFVKVASLLKLVEDARLAIMSLDEGESRDFYLRAFDALDRLGPAMRAHLTHAHMQSYAEYLTDASVLPLEAASIYLRGIGARTPVPSQAQLDDLLDLVRWMIDEVSSHDSLGRQVKLFIIARLRDVESAILSMHIGGFEDIAAAVGAVTSGLFVVPEGPQRGWFVGLLERLLKKTRDSAPAVKEIAESTAAVLDTFEKAKNLV